MKSPLLIPFYLFPFVYKGYMLSVQAFGSFHLTECWAEAFYIRKPHPLPRAIRFSISEINPQRGQEGKARGLAIHYNPVHVLHSY
jgi:hypothetical protein